MNRCSYNIQGNRRKSFSGDVLILGSGAVSRCLQTLLVRHLDIDLARVTIMDADASMRLQSPVVAAGGRFVHTRITRDNLASKLSRYVGAGGLVIDLATNIQTDEIIDWCQRNEVRYVNTSIEIWPGPATTADTVYLRHCRLREKAREWRADGPTAIVEHGANPGLVNHWVKKALTDLSARMLSVHPMAVERCRALEDALNASDFARLARITGTKVIHVSERDSQTSRNNIDFRSEFVNTWSVDGFLEESHSSCELGWGTHETVLPHDAVRHEFGPGNQIYLRRVGMGVFARSWVPSGEIAGMVIPHGETFSISNLLSLYSGRRLVYRPSVYFVYRPSDEALSSLFQVGRGQKRARRPRVMCEELAEGNDEVGILLLGHDLNGWWTGSQLGIGEARSLVGNHNATTLQVAASALAAIHVALERPRLGFRMPEDLDHAEVLELARPYLGPCPSLQTDWRPTRSSARCSQRTWCFGEFEVASDALRLDVAV